MNEFNVCFVGIGSIARRHIRNLQEICLQRGYNLNIDAVRHSSYQREEDATLGIRASYNSALQLESVYDVVFITNPTEYHLDALENMCKHGKHFFVEKPISSLGQMRRTEEISIKENAIYYVACPLRYNAVIQYVKQYIKPEEVIAVRSISSSYLPEWRIGTDYRNTYSAHKEMGGGVSIDLIHEWDYLTYLFGVPKRVQCMQGKKSKLEINSEDYAIYMAEYDDKIVELHLDYFGRKPIRELMIFTNEDTILGDLIRNEITYLSSGKKISFNEERDDYQKRELNYFMDMIEGKIGHGNDIDHALQVLRLTQGEL